jgi:hypothetical protein
MRKVTAPHRWISETSTPTSEPAWPFSAAVAEGFDISVADLEARPFGRMTVYLN